MTRFRLFHTVLLSLAAVLALPVQANDFAVGDLHILQPWSQELPPNSPTVAVYLVLDNQGMNADRLKSVDTPAAGTAEIHAHVDQDGMMKMQKVEDGVSVGPGTRVAFAPMGYHIMLTQLNGPLRDGQFFPLVLHFEKAGDVSVDVDVLKVPPADPR
ncbi:copper chaperone PCu(A)C [Pseudomonas sp. HR96]|uniref:copper chaperone PCu(A)C n=1 Tax=Pseudomonas sp. HR96 TaxID=1027966 RepID=UPI002A74B624|nr:copper chaperone PCu(A)C [Pseudomonas sp. HR96]WPP00474.1 copper chaperone PCu(A)C [Pseudomonas sp. HR96]